jgi:hypothetical protein
MRIAGAVSCATRCRPPQTIAGKSQRLINEAYGAFVQGLHADAGAAGGSNFTVEATVVSRGISEMRCESDDR